MHRVLPIVSHLVLLASTSAAAQATGIAWPPLAQASPSPLYAEYSAGPIDRAGFSREAVDTTPRQIKPTYWKEGGVVGGALGGVFVATLAYGLCTQSEGNTRHCGFKLLGGAVLGAGAGFGLGALIGGQFPKHRGEVPADSSPDHVHDPKKHQGS
jgi:hypothetical protein